MHVPTSSGAVCGLLAMGNAVPMVADQKQGDGGEDDCVDAFKSGNKHVAEQLLPHTRPADVRTTFRFRVGRTVAMVSMVSLLHLAAFTGGGLISVLY